MEIVYTQSDHPLLTGARKFRNPRFFSGVEKASKVFVIGSYPSIVEAYQEADIEVVEVGKMPEKPAPNFAAVDPSAVVIPDGFEHLAWPALRRLAAEVSGAPVLNKGAAVATIEAELARRAAVVEEVEADGEE
jgi:hypothetical protein